MKLLTVRSARLNHCLISLFIIVFFTSNTLWLWLTTPRGLKPTSAFAARLQSILEPIESLTGWEQNWALFSPNINMENTYTLLMITRKNGLLKLVELPRIEKLKFVDKLKNEKYAKLFNDNMIRANNGFIRPDIAKFISRANNQLGNEPVRISFFLVSTPIPPPANCAPVPLSNSKNLPLEKYFVYGVNQNDF